MLTKILVTALIILACYFYLRYQRNKQQSVAGQNDSLDTGSEKSSLSSQIRWVAGGLIGLTVCAAIGIFIYSWMDDRRVLTVKITSPYSGEVVSYQVYKGDMKERSFKTLHGQVIRISDSERIEISETP